MFSVAISPLIFCPGGGEFKLMRFSVDNSFWLMGESRLAEGVLSPGGAWEEHSERAASEYGELDQNSYFSPFFVASFVSFSFFFCPLLG